MKPKNIFNTIHLLSVTFLLFPVNSFSQFCYGKNIPSDTVSYSIAHADFNKDGFEDLASVNMGTHVSIFLGDGHGNFANPVKYDIGAMAMGMSVIARDFNNDGKLDLAVADMMNMTIAVVLGNGNGTFGTPSSFPVAPTPYMLVSADFNNDGKFDIATANAGSDNVSVLLGNGNGSFADSINFRVGPNPTSIASADFNNDGSPDLVVANSTTNYMSILLGNGNGSFADTTNLRVGSSFPQSVICVDMNADGNVDLISANTGSDNNVSVLLSNGNGSFAAATNFQITPSGYVQTYTQAVTAADFNGDGKMDLAAANNGTNDVSILLNNGAGSFITVAGFTAGVSPYAIISADFDKDGAKDIAVANSNSNDISLLLNCPAGRIDTIIKIDTVFAIDTITNVTLINRSNNAMVINVYPNPSDGKFQIVINNLDLTENCELAIYNIQGEKVFYSTSKHLNNSVINITDNPAGIYVLQLKSEKELVMKKIVFRK